MSAVRISIVEDAHAYTRSKIPWQIDTDHAAREQAMEGKRFGWKLFHYISGGGMRTFGRTIQQEERRARQNKFLVLAAVAAALWLAFFVI